MRFHIVVGCFLLTACRTGCDGSLSDPPKVGHAGTHIYVTCDPSGYTVRNEGREPRYVQVSSPCTLNSAQVTLGPHGELPDMVLYSSSGGSPTSLLAVIAPGEEARQELDMASVSHCMDATRAPPGQHEREPVSLVSDGPADALRMRINVHEIGSMDPPLWVDVACRW